MHSARKHRVTPSAPRPATPSTPRPQGMSDADWLLRLSTERVLAVQLAEQPYTALSAGIPTGTEASSTAHALGAPSMALGGSPSSHEPPGGSGGSGCSCSSADSQDSAAPLDDMERLLHASTQRILCMNLESARRLQEAAAAEPKRSSGGGSSTPRTCDADRLLRHRILAAAQAGGSFLRSPRSLGSLHSPRQKMQPPQSQPQQPLPPQSSPAAAAEEPGPQEGQPQPKTLRTRHLQRSGTAPHIRQAADQASLRA